MTNKPNSIVASATSTRHSPRKMRLVADAVRQISRPEAVIAQLELLPHQAAKTLLKVYRQAVANAVNNMKLNPKELRVARLLVEEGPRGPKRADVHAHGARFNRGVRRKRMSHIKLELIVHSQVAEGGQNGTKN